MKKVVLMAAIAVFGLCNVSAQEVSFGAKAGVNFATIGGDDTDGVDGRTSFHIGGVAEIKISEKFSVQPELLYSGQGAKDTYEDEFEKEEATLRLDYLNVPVMAKFYVADGFSLEAGPQVGFLLKSEAEYEYVDKEFPEFNESETVDSKDFTSAIDFGINFGVGYKLDNGLNFGARYNLGLSNINDFEGSDNIKNQNNVIQISIGYFFK